LLAPDLRVVGTPENPGLFETSFLEKDFWNKVTSKMAELSNYCPEERCLVHADCGFDNVLSDGKKITGVIDWENSMYGDSLYDLAWLSFWRSELGYEQMYAEYVQGKGKEIEHFNERVLCYKLWIGLNAMIFFAYSDQKGKYEYAKGILEKLL
jgi:hygromycin-B 4-O-kinase